MMGMEGGMGMDPSMGMGMWPGMMPGMMMPQMGMQPGMMGMQPGERTVNPLEVYIGVCTSSPGNTPTRCTIWFWFLLDKITTAVLMEPAACNASPRRSTLMCVNFCGLCRHARRVPAPASPAGAATTPAAMTLPGNVCILEAELHEMF